jgi:hypothetical protein
MCAAFSHISSFPLLAWRHQMDGRCSASFGVLKTEALKVHVTTAVSPATRLTLRSRVAKRI